MKSLTSIYKGTKSYNRVLKKNHTTERAIIILFKMVYFFVIYNFLFNDTNVITYFKVKYIFSL